MQSISIISYLNCGLKQFPTTPAIRTSKSSRDTGNTRECRSFQRNSICHSGYRDEGIYVGQKPTTRLVCERNAGPFAIGAQQSGPVSVETAILPQYILYLMKLGIRNVQQALCAEIHEHIE